MSQAGRCPSDDVLDAFLEQRLDEPAAAAVAEHVAGCEGCAAVVAALSPTQDGSGGAQPSDRPDGELDDLAAAVVAHLVEQPARPGPAAEGALRVGSVIAAGASRPGTYRLDRRLGQGGMGVVWAATHEPSGERAAIKVLHERHDALAVRRFLREARAQALVKHDNVLQIQDTLTLDDGSPALVMELLQGESLRERLERAGRLTLEETALVLTLVVSAVMAAHQAGMVHRDLKPDNIFLSTGPDGAVHVKVLDFGLVKLMAREDVRHTTTITGTGQLLGTPYYMAPEQAVGDQVDHRVDIWALGVILYECLSGRRPFRGSTPHKVLIRIAKEQPAPLATLLPRLPADVARLVDSMLTRSRRARLSELGGALALLDRHSGRVKPGVGTWTRRRVAIAIAAAGVLSAAGVGIAYHRPPLTEAATPPAADGGTADPLHQGSDRR